MTEPNQANHNLSGTIVVVSGLPRSGTSMMMNMLESGGIELLKDGIRTPDDDNPRGYYEYEAVKGLKDGETSWLGKASGKAVKIISYLLHHLPPTHDYRIIFMQRDLEEVLASQRKMIIRRGEDPDKIEEDKMKRILEKHLSEIDGWIQGQNNIHRIDVPYKRVVDDPRPDLLAIQEFLGCLLDIDAMVRIADPHLYRQRK